MKKRRIVVIIASSLLLAVIGIIAARHFYKQAFIWPDQSAMQLAGNSDIHDRFVSLCLDKNIGEITSQKAEYIIYKNYKYFDGYYIYYSGDQLNQDDLDQISVMLKMLRKYHVKSALFDEQDESALFYIGGFYTVYLGYIQKPQTVDVLKKENSYDDVTFLDDHWYLAHSD